MHEFVILFSVIGGSLVFILFGLIISQLCDELKVAKWHNKQLADALKEALAQLDTAKFINELNKEDGADWWKEN